MLRSTVRPGRCVVRNIRNMLRKDLKVLDKDLLSAHVIMYKVEN